MADEVKVLSFEDIQKWDGDTMRAKLRNPDSRREIEAVLAAKQQDIITKQQTELDKELAEDKAKAEAQAEKEEIERQAAVEAAKTPEEMLAEEAAIKAEAEKAESDKVAAEKAEADRIVSEAVKAEAERKDLEEKARLAEEASKPKQKIVREYQARDEEGNPIGRPTHLEADTNDEMLDKMQEAHIQATRAFHRLKNLRQNAVKAPEPVTLPSEEELLQAVKDLDDKDPVKKLEAVKKIATAESRKAEAAAKAAEERAEGKRITYEWLQKHLHDYNNCKANTDLILGYIKDNSLPWTENNLDLAIMELSSQLAPVVQAAAPHVPEPVVEIKPTPVVNPEPVAAPVAVVAPVVTAPIPVEPPVVAPNAPVVERKLPAGGIEPGTLHGARPVSKTPGLTKQDVAKMPLDEYKKKLRDPAFKRQLNAIGIKA